MKRILIIKLSALGDIVQADGAMHDIRIHHADAEIFVLTTPAYAKLMNRCPWVDRVLIDRRSSWLNIRAMLVLRQVLRNHNFNIVYDLQQVDRTRLYHRLFLGDTKWMGDTRNCDFYCRRPENSSAASHFDHHLAISGVKTSHTLNCDLTWMADDVSEILKTDTLPSEFITLIPGGSAVHPEKRWPFFRELAQKLIDSGHLPVTIPGPDEIDLCRDIPGVMLIRNHSFLDYFQLAGVVQKALFTIGNDTGPTHIAAHLKLPGLALFGGHASAESTGIQHTAFNWIEVQDLRELRLETIWQKINDVVGL